MKIYYLRKWWLYLAIAYVIWLLLILCVICNDRYQKYVLKIILKRQITLMLVLELKRKLNLIYIINHQKTLTYLPYNSCHWASGLRCYNQNRKVPSSNHTRHSGRLRDPRSLQGSRYLWVEYVKHSD